MVFSLNASEKTLSHRPWKTASSTCPGNDPAVSAAGGTDAESGAVFHPEAWFHPHGWNLPDTVHYPGSAEKISGSGCLLFVTNTKNIEQKLLRSELDAAVVEGEIHSPDLIVLPIIDDCLVLAAGKKHPFYRRGRIHVQELNDQKFAVREYGSGTRQLFEDYTLRHGLKIRTAWEANSPQALMNAVLYNQMLSVMSIRLMHHEIRHRSVRVFCNEAGEWNRKFKLVYHKNKFLTPAIFELEKILHTYQQLELPSVMGVLEQE